MPDYQYAFRPNGVREAIREAAHLAANKFHLVQLDISNAFNSIPHSVLINELQTAAPSVQVRRYITDFLRYRYSDDLQAGRVYQVGVPQGDPLSMLLFCHATSHTLETLKEKFTHVVAYADDVVIAVPRTNNAAADMATM